MHRRDRIVGPMRGVLPETALKGIEEQLSGACTTEIAAFDEFTALLTDRLIALCQAAPPEETEGLRRVGI